MKHILKVLVLSLVAVSAGYSTLEAKERLAAGLCTHFKPKFVKKPILDESGNKIGEKQVIDIGSGQELPAGDDWDSTALATDNRITIDFEIKTRRQYRCHQINDPAEKDNLAIECKSPKLGFEHGMITNGSEECFTAW